MIGFALSWPRTLIHWSMPPIFVLYDSWIPAARRCARDPDGRPRLLIGRDVGALLGVGGEGRDCKDCNEDCDRFHERSMTAVQALARSRSLSTVRQFRAVVSTPSSRSAFAASFEMPKPSGV